MNIQADSKNMIKFIVGAVIGFFAFLFILFVFHSMVKYNDSQDYQVVQSVNGDLELKTTGGYYWAFFPHVWTYKKINTVYFSNDRQESIDSDGVNVIFNNMGKGDISCQIVFRLFTDNEKMLKLHQYARGDIDIIENLVLAKLKDVMMTEASKITSSEAIKKRDEYVSRVRDLMINHEELIDMGIVIEQLNVTQISFDENTVQMFEAQQKADLAEQAAKAMAQQLEQEKIRVEKDAAKQIAEAKGKAEVEMTKQVTDAERSKRLAEIDAAKKVEVEKLAAQEAEVKAKKELEVAKIQFETEKTKLEVVKVQAQQQIEEAKANEQRIKLSGAITETEKVRLEVEKDTKIGVATALANGIKSWALPKTVILGNSQGTNGVSNPIDTLVQLLTVQKAEEVSK